MRPLNLRIQAFGPYITPLELNFEKNLHDEKIFLIHGATGAGKTTILDAICFALYGTASGDERDAAMMRSKGISASVKTVVEFSFALGKKIYDVKRTLTYHPNRKTNQNPIDAELRCDGQLVETQTRNVTNAITELLSFNAKQFRQVVLLPQGEFKNFLSANSADRQPILDTLFNAALYIRIEDGLKLKADAAQEDFDDLNGTRETLTRQLQGAKCDDAALEKLRADYKAAQEESARLKKIFDDIHREHIAAEILSKDFAELADRNKALQTAEENLAAAEKNFAAAKTEYDLRAAQQVQRDKLNSDADKLAEIKKALAELDTKRRALAVAEKNLQSATDALKKCESDAKNFDELLAKREKRRDELSGADVEFAQLKTLWQRANQRDELKRATDRLKRTLEIEQEKLAVVTENFTAAQIKLNRLQIMHSAAHLATQLKPGEPCPVCGSLEHPAIIAEAVPSADELQAAEKNLERLTPEKEQHQRTVDNIIGELSAKEELLKNFDDVPDTVLVKKNLDAAQKKAAEFADCKRRIDKGKRLIAENNDALNKARDKKNSAASVHDKLFGEVQTFQAQIPEKYSADSQQLEDDLAALKNQLKELNDAWKSADENFRKTGNKKSSCEGALKSARESQIQLADKLKDSTPPDLDALKTHADEAQKNHEAAIRAENSLKNSLDNITKLASQIAELDEKISAAEKTLRLWKKLSDAACGKIRGNKLSFARYYLSAMFDQVLTEANYRLEKMSDRRYNLQNRHAIDRSNEKLGLNLEIFDDFTGETRPVATLSGGESFLASLALALGLAAVVRNNLGGIKLDTIFIDEGFGSLDSETLDDAISTIIEQSGGRLVGIISHVEELKNQMPVRLEVTKGKTGSTARFIS